MIIKWNEYCDESFENQRNILISSSIPKYTYFSILFVVTTNPSDIAIGAILSQDYAGNDLPIAFVSRMLNSTSTF